MKMLIIRPGALGDTILSLPAIHGLRRWSGSEARLELVGYPAVLRLALNPLHADIAHPMDRALFSGLFSDTFTREVRAFLRGFDLVIAWCWDRDHYLEGLLRGLRAPFVRDDPHPAPGSGTHASDHLLSTLAPLGIKGRAELPRILIPAGAHQEAEALLREKCLCEGEFVAIHPGSGSARKNWSPRRFSDLALRVRRAGFDVLLIAGEADREPVGAVLDGLVWRPPVADQWDVFVVAATLSRARAYVGNDSGVTHLAAAVGAPTLALFGSTDAKTWSPRGRSVRVLPHDTGSEGAWSELERLLG